MLAFVPVVFLTLVYLVTGPVALWIAVRQRGVVRRQQEEIAILRQAIDRLRATQDASEIAPVMTSSPAAQEPDSEAPRAASVYGPARVVDTNDGVSAKDAEGSVATDDRMIGSDKATGAGSKAVEAGFEEMLGARWTVWAGGAALALGALLLVRYTIDQGYFGPGARIVLGLLVSGFLVGAGEFMRRRERPPVSQSPAYIPGALTAAGIVGAFGAVYAAHGLYGFIGPGAAFFCLGVLAVGSIAAAIVHGPALAGLGLAGALATPMLVSSPHPNPWPAVVYLSVVAAAAYALARLRQWLWLAVSAAVGTGLWTLAFAIDESGAAYLSLAVQTALAALAFGVLPHFRERGESAELDRVASLVLCGFALLAAAVLSLGPSSSIDASWLLASIATVAILAAVGASFAAAAVGLPAAAVVALAAMTVWPSDGPSIPLNGLHRGVLGASWFVDAMRRRPDNVSLFVTCSVLAAAAIAALAVWRLRLTERLDRRVALVYASTGAVMPLAALAIADIRLTQASASGALALAAGIAAAAFAFFAARFEDGRQAGAAAHLRIAFGAFAVASVAALSEGLVFALDGGALTVALALVALACAVFDDRFDIPALRWCVGALGLAVAGRLAYDPRVVGAGLSTTPILNWLLFGYGVPAVAFGLAGAILRRKMDSPPARIADALAVVFSAFLVFFEIRHAMNGGNPFARATGLVEQGLLVVSCMGFALVLSRLHHARSNVVFQVASEAAGALGLGLVAISLLLAVNPLFTGERISGGFVVNALLLGYLVPSALVAAWARLSNSALLASVVAILLAFAYATLETRLLFRGPSIAWDRGIGDVENYAYSAVWLFLGVALLAYGVLRRSAEARYASAFFVVAATAKVFLLDLNRLEGALRALSFLGLGVALIGIGLVYQKVVFARTDGDDAAPERRRSVA